MDIFAQKKLLVRIVILLMLLNLLSVGAFIWKDVCHKPPTNRNDFRDVSSILKRELNLTEKQFEQIKLIRSIYFEKETELVKVMRAERDSMNVAMFNKNDNDSLIKSLARRVSDNEYKMELLRFQQARELKSICTPAQLEKFQGLVLEIRDYFRPDNNPEANKK